jgi:hypothetical protein
MSRDDLNPFSYTVLALVGGGGDAVRETGEGGR